MMIDMTLRCLNFRFIIEMLENDWLNKLKDKRKREDRWERVSFNHGSDRDERAVWILWETGTYPSETEYGTLTTSSAWITWSNAVIDWSSLRYPWDYINIPSVNVPYHPYGWIPIQWWGWYSEIIEMLKRIEEKLDKLGLWDPADLLKE